MKTVDVDVLVEELQKAAAHKGLGAAIAGIILEYIEMLPAIDVVERSSFEAIADKYVQIQDKLIQGELVPVLRCKDCKKFVASSGGFGICIHHSELWGEDGFCSCGERRTDD